jgi:hypothetical protein
MPVEAASAALNLLAIFLAPGGRKKAAPAQCVARYLCVTVAAGARK